MTRALVPLADGCEEMEAVIIIDSLRRAGWEVVSAGLHVREVAASRGVKLVADTLLADVDRNTFDVIVLPGGGDGTEALKKDERVLELLRAFQREDKLVAAVCAAPLVLQAAGLLDGRTVTCYPGMQSEMTAATWVPQRVVIDGRIITSQGPGTSFEFVLAIISDVEGPAKAKEVGDAMMVTSP